MRSYSLAVTIVLLFASLTAVAVDQPKPEPNVCVESVGDYASEQPAYPEITFETYIPMSEVLRVLGTPVRMEEGATEQVVKPEPGYTYTRLVYPSSSLVLACSGEGKYCSLADYQLWETSKPAVCGLKVGESIAEFEKEAGPRGPMPLGSENLRIREFGSVRFTQKEGFVSVKRVLIRVHVDDSEIVTRVDWDWPWD